MKTKHYIYIGIGILLAIIISIPAYYYYKGYTLSDNSYDINKNTLSPNNTRTFCKNKCNIIVFITAYYLSKFTKKDFNWTLEKPIIYY